MAKNLVPGHTYPKINEDGSVLFGSDNGYTRISTNGIITLHGTARITTDLWIDAGGVRAPGLKPATFVLLGLTGVWQFANAGAGNEESVSGTLKIPSGMDRTVVPIFKVGWSADGISPGNCEWQLEYLWVGPNDATDAAAQEALTATGTASATSNGLVITAFSGIDLPADADQAMLWEITRLSNSGNDTIADTVEMRGRLFTYTVDKLGTPI